MLMYLTRGFSLILLASLLSADLRIATAQSFEEAVIDAGNVGVTVTNSGFVGKANVRNNPTGPPSFRYPLGSGVEHLFEAGIWVGARRDDGTVTVRSGAVTSSTGYQPGVGGYELAPLTPIFEQSSLPESDAFSPTALSHQDFVSTLNDTATRLPGTFIPMPDPAGQLGMLIESRSYAWNFPFAEHFVILDYHIINISDLPWHDIHVGIYNDLVVRNVNTTTDTGSDFFNKGGLGFVDSLHAIYAFNAGGQEETVNTYGAISFVGSDWRDPNTGQVRFFHPDHPQEMTDGGYAAPEVIPRWWRFSGGTAERGRPANDEERYRRMRTPFPNPEVYPDQQSYEQARDAFFEELRTGGQRSDGNWIGLISVGPYPRVDPGDTLNVTFALVAALKPEEYQGQAGKPIDTPDSRRILAENLEWVNRIYGGEDVTGDGVRDRYVFPEPPPAPSVRTELEPGKVTLYWDDRAEFAIDPITGEADFEGYRVYRSNPGDDRDGDILARASMIAQWDRPGTGTGFNTGFDDIRLPEPVTFPDDTTQYRYRFEVGNLSSGWQYLFSVTAFDRGDPQTGLPSLESSRVANAVRVFPGTPPAEAGENLPVGVYPNPYRVNAAWDGGTARTRKLYFYNLPARCEIRVYTLAGEVVARLDHDADTYQGDTRWFDQFAPGDRVMAGGEHAWDILSDNSLNLAAGLYLFSVQDLDTGQTQAGKFAIVK